MQGCASTPREGLGVVAATTGGSGLAEGGAGTIMGVNDDPTFDQWVTDEGGPEGVVAMVDDLRRQADDGVLPGFSDKDEFLAHLERRDRRSA